MPDQQPAVTPIQKASRLSAILAELEAIVSTVSDNPLFLAFVPAKYQTYVAVAGEAVGVGEQISQAFAGNVSQAVQSTQPASAPATQSAPSATTNILTEHATQQTELASKLPSTNPYDGRECVISSPNWSETHKYAYLGTSDGAEKPARIAGIPSGKNARYWLDPKETGESEDYIQGPVINDDDLSLFVTQVEVGPLESLISIAPTWPTA